MNTSKTKCWNKLWVLSPLFFFVSMTAFGEPYWESYKRTCWQYCSQAAPNNYGGIMNTSMDSQGCATCDCNDGRHKLNFGSCQSCNTGGGGNPGPIQDPGPGGLCNPPNQSHGCNQCEFNCRDHGGAVCCSELNNSVRPCVCADGFRPLGSGGSSGGQSGGGGSSGGFPPPPFRNK